jgi:DNA-binding beta-propeller fold protein YncE
MLVASSSGPLALSLALCSLSFHPLFAAAVTDGDVTTLAGFSASNDDDPFSFGPSGGSTNGVGSNAQFDSPNGVSISPDGSYALVVDTYNQVIRKIVLSSANVSTLAGLTGSSGSTNGVGSNALFSYPNGVSISSDGSYALVADTVNNLIRKIAISTANVSTLAGLTGSA